MPLIEYPSKEVAQFTNTHAERLKELEREISILEASVVAGDSGLEERIAIELYGKLRTERQVLYLAQDLVTRIRLTRSEIRAKIDVKSQRMLISTHEHPYEHSITWHDLESIANEVLDFHDQLIELLLDTESFEDMRGKYFDVTIQDYSDKKLRARLKSEQAIVVAQKNPK